MADKDLIFSMNVLPNMKKQCISASCGVSKWYTSGTIANSQRTPTEINKNGAIFKVRMLVKLVTL